MRAQQFLLATVKEAPSDAEIISHQLMLRSGMIRKVAAGIYAWLPLGIRVLKKVEQIIREEMTRAGALEVLLPAVQPAELWQETGRWQAYGPELLRLKDRNERDFCFGPTHEEVITELMRRELKSYKQLPMTLFQIQTKFRDEIRPRFGVMRSREFIMKDAYSFHQNTNSLESTYQVMFNAYTQIFTRLGLNFRCVLADTGSIGGRASHEFQVLAQSGEDILAISDSSDYAANLELAEALAPQEKRPEATKPIQKNETPGIQTIKDLCTHLKVAAQQTVKTLIVHGSQSPLVALVIRGDHELNPIKAEKLPEVAAPLTLASEQEIQNLLSCKPGYLGPVKLAIPVIVDRDAAVLGDFICGANEDNFHYLNVNWERDANYDRVADLRAVVAGDLSPDGKGTLQLTRGIEVGHIFQLGDKYSKSMHATVLDDSGREIVLEMGCYGIGVTRIVSAAIEQNHDERGILWPEAIAPFQVAMISIAGQPDSAVIKAADELYEKLRAADIDVFYDDRDDRPGVKFADCDLLGIPHRIVIGERGLSQGQVEYKSRCEKASIDIKLDSLVNLVQDKKADWHKYIKEVGVCS